MTALKVKKNSHKDTVLERARENGNPVSAT
jgi:hypothetical protein